jgi:2,3-bisphosphoglycerate-dependent phosphoglycerate mutase
MSVVQGGPTEQDNRRQRRYASVSWAPSWSCFATGRASVNVEPSRFTGWVDVDLNERGRREAAEAGRLMAGGGLGSDVVDTSVLTQAIRTTELALAEMGLTERGPGCRWCDTGGSTSATTGLQGLDKAETASTHGEEQVHVWRPRSGHGRPSS